MTLTLGQKIRKLRELKGYSQQYVAKKLNISQEYYSYLENKQKEIPPEYLLKISQLFDVTPDFIENFDSDKILHQGLLPEPIKESKNGNGHAPNICFTLPNGHRIFLNYNYLISGEYDPASGKIILTFTKHILTLSGIRSELLFNDIMHHIAKEAICAEEQDPVIESDDVLVVSNIEIIPNDGVAE